jgi:polyisoprenoid-binding protein YceI
MEYKFLNEAIMKSLITTIFIFLFVISSNMQAQQYNYILLDKSSMQIEGTSTIHDWTCDVQEINADISFAVSEANISPVESLSLTVPVKKIESGKGGMNKKIYEALKEKKHSNISFKLSTSEVATSGTNGNGSSFRLMANGMLSIAGVTREISFPVDGSVQDNDTYKFAGNYEINMKDYNVDPPTAVFGTIKSGELVTVSFELFIAKR